MAAQVCAVNLALSENKSNTNSGKHRPQKWVPWRACSTDPGLSRASLRRALRLGFTILAAEAGSDGAIDLNKIC